MIKKVDYTMDPDKIAMAEHENYVQMKKANPKLTPATMDLDVLSGRKPLKKKK